MLSATGEANPQLAWEVNMNGLKLILDLAVKYKMRVFWPSSIAAFGPTTPKVKTPQRTVLEPTTMYGVTKLAGELLCQYYTNKYGLDIRSVRYPGLISYKAEPGGGTTDYAVAIFYEAIKTGKYECFVKKETTLPMMYMDDAIEGTIKLMDALGNEVLHLFNGSLDEGNQNHLFDTNEKVAPGFYFLRVASGSETVVKRISVK